MRHVLIFALLIFLVSACEASDPAPEPANSTPDVPVTSQDVVEDSSAANDTSAPDTTTPVADSVGPGSDGVTEPDALPLGCTTDADCEPGEICEVNSGVCLADSGCDDQCELGDVGCTGDVA